MIRIENLSKSFGIKKAVDNLSLSVPNGKIFGFLGPNGAGKSTTIKLITGALEYDVGNITINNIDLKKNPLAAKKQIAYVPDEPTFLEHMTGIEYLNFISNIFEISISERKANIEKFSNLFDITVALNDKISGYSHGMKQKLALISAFVHCPKVIILDEPMVGLDAKTARTLKNLLKEFVLKGNTVFYSTHVMDMAERFCDIIAIINKGKLIYTGTFDKLKEETGSCDSTLEDIFLELTWNDE